MVEPAADLILAAVACFQGAASTSAAPVEIVGDFDLPRVRTESLAIAEATWKETCALFGVDAKPDGRPDSPSLPVKVHLDAELAEYEAACDRLVGGNFKRNLCFSEWTTFSAHVLLQPQIRDEAWKNLAPTWQTLRLVAHETSHLARFTTMPNHRSQPDWIADGCATWVESRALATRKLLTTPEKAPFFGSLELRVQRVLKLDRLPSVDDLVHDRTETLEFYDRYAVRWLLFRFLIEGAHAKELRDFLGDVRSLGGGDDFRERAAAALQKRLGESAWKKLDSELRAWIPTLKPEWEEAIGTLAIVGDEGTQCAFDSNAVAFTTAPAGSKPFAIEGSVTAWPDRKKPPQMNLLLGRQLLSSDNLRYASVAFVPGDGVTVLEYDGGQRDADAWKNRGYGAAKETAAGKPIPFRVECEPKAGKTSVTVKIAGKAVTQVTLDRVLDGPWGLGAQAGCSGKWRGVRCVPLASH